jgi:hypothetical protein
MAAKRADRFWSAVGAGGTEHLVLSSWVGLAGDDMPLLRRFLHRASGRATTWPCRRMADGCVREVRRFPDGGFRALCGDRDHGCDPDCLDGEQIQLWKLDISKIWQEVCDALSLVASAQSQVDGRHEARWTHADKASSTAVYLALTHDAASADAAVSGHVGVHKEPIVLMVPSHVGWDRRLVDRAAGRGVMIEVLADLLWRRDRAFAPARLLGEGEVPATRAMTRTGGRVALVQRRGRPMLLLEFGGSSCEISATRSARMLMELLVHRGEDFEYRHLVAEFLAGSSDAADAPVLDDELEPEGGLGPTMSADDMARVRGQVEVLRQQLPKVDDAGRDRILNEIQRTEAFLKKNLGIHDRPRLMSDPGEKDSRRVRTALDRLIADIRQEHASLAAHLNASIKRRNGVRYVPKPDVEWSE